MWPELPAKRQRHESVVYRIYLFIYLSIYLSLSLSISLSLSLSLYISLSNYVSVYLSIYLHRQAGKTFGACGRREKHPLDRGHGASIVFARGQEPYADM